MDGKIRVQFINSMGSDLTIVNAARVSFGRESQQLDEGDQKLMRYLAKHKHYSPFEHCSLSVLIECPLFIRSQIHRHRTFAYNEISRRYTSENLEFYIPPADDIRAQSKSNKQASDGPIDVASAEAARQLIHSICEQNLNDYETLLALGVTREQARMILPQNLMTKFYMTGNLRNWAHFVALREDGHAQKEVQVIAKDVRVLLEREFPAATAALLPSHLPAPDPLS